jgi:hypothetical protein
MPQNMFTIKSVSEEGTFYLVRNWNKNQAIWSRDIKAKFMFSTAKGAKGALTKLLKVMDEYSSDTFYIVETDSKGNVVAETPYAA